jgi:DNA-binding protein HU-beta
MTKTEIIATLADHNQLSKAQVKGVLESMNDLAFQVAKEDGVFPFPGLGKLVKVDRKARVGRNPRTGEPVQVPAKIAVKFRLSKVAKDAVLG